MKTLKFSKTIENVLIVLVGIVFVLIPIMDFIGCFEHVEWVKARIPVFILLSIGILTVYLVSHLNNTGDEAIERQRELLRNIKLDEVSAKFKDLLESSWQKRERDIQKLFTEANDQTKRGVNMEEFVKNSFEQMVSGDYFGAKVALPWDFTLCALDYDGVVIYHPGIRKGTRLDDMVVQKAIKERNGTALWENDLCSEQLASIFPNHAPGNRRFTRIYFKDFPDLKAVVILESHINIIDKLPAIKLQREQNVQS